jgi:NADH-quinone oxidoreductase subunit L
LLWVVGAVTSLMTAFYMFRLVFLAFHGERRHARAEALGHHPPHAPAPVTLGHGTPHVSAGMAQGHDTPHAPAPVAQGHDTPHAPAPVAQGFSPVTPAAHHAAHLHDAPMAMAIPLVVLAIGSVVAGYLNVPAGLGGSAVLEHFLEPSLHVPAMAGAHAAAEHADHALEIILMVVSSAIAFAGIGLAAFLYLKRTDIPDALVAKFPGVYRFLVHKGYIDELYDAVVVQPIKALSEGVLWKADVRVIDGAVNGTGQIVVETGSLVRRVQTGSVRTYAVSVLFGAVLVVGYFLWS